MRTTEQGDSNVAARYDAAMKDVAGGMSMRKAAKTHDVKYENLRRRVHGNVPVACRRGPQLVYLSPEAHAALLEIIHRQATCGMRVNKAEMTRLIRMAAEITSTRPIPASFPGVTFVKRWLAKHSDSVSMPTLENAATQASPTEAITYNYDSLKALIDQVRLRDQPAQA